MLVGLLTECLKNRNIVVAKSDIGREGEGNLYVVCRLMYLSLPHWCVCVCVLVCVMTLFICVSVMTLFITFIYNRGEIESSVNFLFLPIKLCWCVCFVYENALRVHRSATDQECVCVCGWVKVDHGFR